MLFVAKATLTKVCAGVWAAPTGAALSSVHSGVRPSGSPSSKQGFRETCSYWRLCAHTLHRLMELTPLPI